MATQSLDQLGKISRRSYRRLRDAVDSLTCYFEYQGTAQHAIFNIVRQRFGCRATEIRECDLDDALELVADLKKHVEAYGKVNADFQVNAIKQVFGEAGTAALEEDAQEALSKLRDPYELPDPPPIIYSSNVLQFPMSEKAKEHRETDDILDRLSALSAKERTQHRMATIAAQIEMLEWMDRPTEERREEVRSLQIDLKILTESIAE